MKKILLHVCCAPCAGYVIQELQQRNFKVTAFFYNPNIYPMDEYKKRRDEVKKYCEQKNIEFIEEEYDYNGWLDKICRNVVSPYSEKEGRKRCEMCYQIRLERTVQFAKKNNYQYFDSTLSISPYKNYEKIKQIGENLVQKYNLQFYGQNWKKQDGFKKACELSHQQDFYRQNYCGCEFSINGNK